MFKNIKKNIQNWAFDTDGVNKRKKEVIEQILPLIEEIKEIWYCSLISSSLLEQKQKAQLNLLYASSGNSYLLDQYNKGMLNNFKTREELIIYIKKISSEHNLRIAEEDLLAIINCLTELFKIDIVSVQARNQVLAENAAKIYNNLVIINAIQKKYMDLSNIIGYPSNLDEILGMNGEKIKTGDPIALRYIDDIIELSNKFKAELSFINAREISKNKLK